MGNTIDKIEMKKEEGSILITSGKHSMRLPNKYVYSLFEIAMDMMMDRMTGVHKILYNMRKENLDKDIKVWIPTYEKNDSGSRLYVSCNIGCGVTNEDAIANILSIWNRLTIDKIDDSEKGIITVELKY